MSDSPRPVRTMPVATTGFGQPSRGIPAAAAPLRWLLDGAHSALCRAALLPLVFAAVALPAHGSHRTPATPVAHSASRHATPVAAGTPGATSKHKPSAVLAAAKHGRPAAAPSLPVAANHRGKAVVPARPLSRRERQAADAAERDKEREEAREQALAALRERASLHTSRVGSRHGIPERDSARLPAHDSARVEVPRDLPRPRHAAFSGSAANPKNEDAAASETPVEDRVHAWYRTRHPAADENSDASERTVPALTPAAADRAPAKKVVATAGPAPAAPDLSETPHKASAADFAHAAAVQRDTIAAAHDQQVHQTTSDDDNADAESRIPSTAPTEREPLPFVHGSFGDGTVSTEDQPAGHSRRDGAPIVRQAPPSVPSVASRIAPPQHVDLKHRGDGLNSALAADAAAQSGDVLPSRAARGITVATAADSSPEAIRALAQQTAASPTPVLKLPAPPSGALRKDLPAVAAVQSNARHRDLEPAVASGMAEETFEEGGAPATARTAVALAAPGAAAGLVPTRTHAVATADDGESNLPAAAAVSVNLFDRQGKLILVPPMKGSHEILVHQNQMAVADGLERIQDDRDLLDLRQRKLLVALPNEDSTYPDDRLPANRRYARPWTVRFLRDLAKAHYARFGTPLIVTSAARTVEFQRRLVRVNGNAAPPTGDIASPHLYGQAMDIGKGHMSLTELTWMRAYLTPVENDGKIDVEEEFQQSCFHISVYRRYLGLPTPRRTVPPASSSPAQLLTAKSTPAPEESKPAEKKHRRISTALLATGLR